MHTFRHRIELDHPVETVFAWHGRPGAFQRLAPAWAKVRLLAATGGIERGGRVTLELRKGPARLRWELAHTHFEENRLFVDEQVAGPFAGWRHEHQFEALAPNRCALTDVVTWQAPLGTLGSRLGEGFMQRSLRRLFLFREARLRGDLELHRRLAQARGADAPPLNVAITGATGLIGTELANLLTAGGHTVRRISRGRAGDIRWDPAAQEIEAAKLEGLDAVVHLAGEPIGNGRWTARKKLAVHRSRKAGTLLLARTLAGLAARPAVFVSGSAVGYYGDRGDELLPETAAPGAGFLADVCLAWERATDPAQAAGIRTVRLRTGMVLSAAGGALPAMRLPFQFGAGGRLGSGRQYMPWIDIDDELGLCLHAIASASVHGAMNAAAPEPLQNGEFSTVLGRVLRRPALLPVPDLAIRILLGEMGEALLLQGQRAIPAKALATGYAFLRPDLQESLRTQLGRFTDRAAAG